MASSLAGRVAVVTGGASGIGEEFCRLVAAKGAHVAVLDVQREAGEEVAASLRRGSPPARSAFVFCDVTRRESVIDAFAAVRARLGVPTIVVNNAGVAQTRPLLEDEADAWRRMIDINLTGVIQGTKTGAQAMIEAGEEGCIVNVSSQAGLVATPMSPVYCATKWGVVGFTRSMAPLAAEGVRVVAVCPAFTDTALVRNAVAETPALGDAIGMVQERLLGAGEVAAQILRLVETGPEEGAAPGRCLEVGAGGSRFVRFRGDPKAPTAAL